MPAVALTDHGSLAGSVDLYKAARDQGIKPIVGCEVYVADDRHSRTRGYAHLTLLAESNAGYSNLIKLSSLGYLEGYYTKPRVDWELLERYSGGLIALSGCLSGRVCKALEENRPKDAAADLDRLATGVRARQHLRRAPERRASRCSSASTRSSSSSRPRRSCRSSPPATSTTSPPRTPTRTRRCSASSRATRSRTRITGSSTRTSSISRRRRRWRSTSPATRTRCGARSRSPSAARSRSSSATSCCRGSRRRTTATRSSTSSSCASRGSSAATTR